MNRTFHVAKDVLTEEIAGTAVQTQRRSARDFSKSAQRILRNIKTGEEYIEGIKNACAEAFGAIKNGTRVIICGNSPYTGHIIHILREEYDVECIVVDIVKSTDTEEVSFLNASPKSDVYILASSVYLGYYSALLSSRGIAHIIPYHTLPMLDPGFDYPRKAYSAQFFKNGIDSIVKTGQIYKALLDSFIDDESIEIMSKLILYRLTADHNFAHVPSHKDIYFGHTFMNVSENEIVIDGGGFDGDSLESYVRHYRRFSEYWLFEPEETPIRKAKERFQYLENVRFMNTGLYDKAQSMSFQADGHGMGRIADTGDAVIMTGKLDDMVTSAVSFIKLDVEGAELAALRGAEQMIRKNRPKLAISVYHNPEDIIEIPKYIKELVPEYKLYLRCGYNSLYNDLVLFAAV
jgi:FkbM family methyltransferase